MAGALFIAGTLGFFVSMTG
jgi:hypothetical protein